VSWLVDSSGAADNDLFYPWPPIPPLRIMAQTHQSLIASLDPALRRDLLERSDGAGLAHLAGHVGAVAGVGALILNQAPFWPALLLVQGVLVIFLFTTLHETIHRTAFKSPWLNQAVAVVCGLVVFLPPTWFRYFHFEHHRFTNDPARDPELATAKPKSRAQYWFYLTGLAVWWFQFRALAVNAAGGNDDSFVPAKGKPEVAAEARLYLAAYGLLAAGSLVLASDALIWVWLAPAALGQPFLRAYLLAEHAGCPEVENMLENSRTTITNGVIRFITWNMPYHVEHHVMPSVPFHKLAELHRHTAPHATVIEPGFIHFHRRMAATPSKKE